MGICKDQLRVITVYLPDKDEWIDNKVRKRYRIPAVVARASFTKELPILRPK